MEPASEDGSKEITTVCKAALSMPLHHPAAGILCPPCTTSEGVKMYNVLLAFCMRLCKAAWYVYMMLHVLVMVQDSFKPLTISAHIIAIATKEHEEQSTTKGKPK
ncbi:hypothetical protein EDC04DRAFT_2610558 [Pisolithus marmoratus]|nr:hypothetical protein EDC04DRAFT_2610558 [Pisolithus marmoratus]